MSASSPTAREVTGEEGRERALRELGDPVYREAEPSLIDRFLNWFWELIGSIPVAVPGVGGTWVTVAFLLVLAALVVWLIVWLRPSRTRRAEGAVHESTPRSAADHRAAAERHEAAGEYASAIAERMRAVSVDLEDRAILTPRAGRTATELANEAAAVLPGLSEALHGGAQVFNDVVYGDRIATAEAAAALRELDERLRAERPAAAEEESR